MSACHSQPFARAHCKTARYPRRAASRRVSSFQSQPFARAHCSASRFPPLAAILHVPAFQEQPFALIIIKEQLNHKQDNCARDLMVYQGLQHDFVCEHVYMVDGGMV